MLKDSVPCPIPNLEKDATARPFFPTDITHDTAPFNSAEAIGWFLDGGNMACVANSPQSGCFGNPLVRSLNVPPP